MDVRDYVIIGVATWMLAWSLAAFIAFGIDKRAARLGRRRIPEVRLHMLEFLGGWPGAFLGAVMFRHKIAKAGFMLVMALIILAWSAMGWLVFKSLG